MIMNAHGDLHLSAGAGEVLGAQGGGGGSVFQKTPEIKLPGSGGAQITYTDLKS